MPPEVVRLTSPTGSTVVVPPEKAERLLLHGYRPIEEKPKRTRSVKSDDATTEEK